MFQSTNQHQNEKAQNPYPRTVKQFLRHNPNPDNRYWLPLEAKALVQPLGSENNWAEVGDGRCELDGLTLRVVALSYERREEAAEGNGRKSSHPHSSSSGGEKDDDETCSRQRGEPSKIRKGGKTMLKQQKTKNGHHHHHHQRHHVRTSVDDEIDTTSVDEDDDGHRDDSDSSYVTTDSDPDGGGGGESETDSCDRIHNARAASMSGVVNPNATSSSSGTTTTTTSSSSTTTTTTTSPRVNAKNDITGMMTSGGESTSARTLSVFSTALGTTTATANASVFVSSSDNDNSGNRKGTNAVIGGANAANATSNNGRKDRRLLQRLFRDIDNHFYNYTRIGKKQVNALDESEGEGEEEDEEEDDSSDDEEHNEATADRGKEKSKKTTTVEERGNEKGDNTNNKAKSKRTAPPVVTMIVDEDTKNGGGIGGGAFGKKSSSASTSSASLKQLRRARRQQKKRRREILYHYEDLDEELEETRTVLLEDHLTEETPLVGDNMCIVWNSIEQHLSLCIMFQTEEAFAVTWAAIHSAQRGGPNQIIPPIRQHIDAIFPPTPPLPPTNDTSLTSLTSASSSSSGLVEDRLRSAFVDHLFVDADVKYMAEQREARRKFIEETKRAVRSEWRARTAGMTINNTIIDKEKSLILMTADDHSNSSSGNNQKQTATAAASGNSAGAANAQSTEEEGMTAITTSSPQNSSGQLSPLEPASGKTSPFAAAKGANDEEICVNFATAKNEKNKPTVTTTKYVPFTSEAEKLQFLDKVRESLGMAVNGGDNGGIATSSSSSSRAFSLAIPPRIMTQKPLQQIERYAIAASIIEADFLNKYPRVFFSMPNKDDDENHSRLSHNDSGSKTTTTTTKNGTNDRVRDGSGNDTDEAGFSHPHPRVVVGLLLLSVSELLDHIVNSGLPEDDEEDEEEAENRDNGEKKDKALPLSSLHADNPLLLLSQQPRKVYDSPYERWIRSLDHVYGNDDALIAETVFGKAPRDNMSPKLSTTMKKQQEQQFNDDDAQQFPLSVPIWFPPAALSRLPMAVSLQKALNAALRVNFLRNEVLPHGGFDVSRVIAIKSAASLAASSSGGGKRGGGSGIVLSPPLEAQVEGKKKEEGKANTNTANKVGGQGASRPPPLSPTTLTAGGDHNAGDDGSPQIATSSPFSGEGMDTTTYDDDNAKITRIKTPINTLLAEHFQTLPIVVEEDTFGLMDQTHHRLLNEVLCSLLVDDSKKLLPQAVVQLLVLPSGKRLPSGELPAKVVEALEFLRNQPNREHDDEAHGNNSNSSVGGGDADGSKKSNEGGKTTSSAPIRYPTLEAFLDELVQGKCHLKTEQQNNGAGSSSSSFYHTEIIADPQTHVTEHLKFFASMLSLAITAFSKDLLPAVVAKLFAPGLLAALSFVVKHYVICERDSNHNHSSKTATPTTAIYAVASAASSSYSSFFTYSPTVDKELLAFLQIAIVKLNEKAEEAVLNELIRIPIAESPTDHVPLLQYFVRAALGTTDPSRSSAALLSTHNNGTTSAAAGVGGIPSSSTFSSLPCDSKEGTTTSTAAMPSSPLMRKSLQKREKSMGGDAAAINTPSASNPTSNTTSTSIDITFTPIGTNNMLLFHLLGLHDDEGMTCERFADPTINEQRDVFHSFLISNVLAKELLRLKEVENATFEDFKAFSSSQSQGQGNNAAATTTTVSNSNNGSVSGLFGTAKKPAVFLPASTLPNTRNNTRNRVTARGGGASSSAPAAAIALPEVTYARLLFLQNIAMTMNETILRVLEYMLMLCANDNKEQLCLEVLFHNESVVLPWVEAAAEAASIKQRMAVAAATATTEERKTETNKNITVNISSPPNLLTGSVRFIRSLMNMCAPWYSPTGKTTHITSLFTSPPPPRPDSSSADDDTNGATAAGSKKGSSADTDMMDTAVVCSSPPSKRERADDDEKDGKGGDRESPTRQTDMSRSSSSSIGDISFGSPIMKRQDAELDLSDGAIATPTSNNGGNSNTNNKDQPQQQQSQQSEQQQQRPLSADLQHANDWIGVVSHRLFASWRSNYSNALLSLAIGGMGMGGGVGGVEKGVGASLSSSPSSPSASASPPPPPPTVVVNISPADRAKLFMTSSKTILHYYLIYYVQSGGPRKLGLYHSTLRSLLQLLESDINPLDLPANGMGSFQKYNLSNRKNFFVGKFPQLPQPPSSPSPTEDDTEGDEEDASSSGKKSGKSSSSSKEKKKDKKAAAKDKSNNSGTSKNSNTATAKDGKKQQQGSSNNLGSELSQLADAVNAVNSSNNNGDGDSADGVISTVSLAEAIMKLKYLILNRLNLLAFTRQTLLYFHRTCIPIEFVNTWEDVARRLESERSVAEAVKAKMQQQQQQQQNNNNSVANSTALLKVDGGGGAGSSRRSSSAISRESPLRPIRAGSSHSLHNNNSPSHHATAGAAATPPRTSPVSSSSRGTPTPPRMVDELSLQHPPNSNDNTLSSSSSSLNTSGGGPGGNNSNAFPRRLRDMMAKINGGGSTATTNNNNNAQTTAAGGASSSSSNGSSPNTSPNRPAAAVSPNPPPRSTPPRSSSTGGGTSSSAAVTSNTSGRVSPKRMPSKPAAEPPMRRRHRRAGDGVGSSTSNATPTAEDPKKEEEEEERERGNRRHEKKKGPQQQQSSSLANSTSSSGDGGALPNISLSTTAKPPPRSSSSSASPLRGEGTAEDSDIVRVGDDDRDNHNDDDEYEPSPQSPLTLPIKAPSSATAARKKKDEGGVDDDEDDDVTTPSPSVSPASVMAGLVLPNIIREGSYEGKGGGDSTAAATGANNKKTVTTGSTGKIVVAPPTTRHTPTPPLVGGGGGAPSTATTAGGVSSSASSSTNSGGPSTHTSSSSSGLSRSNSGGGVKRRPSVPADRPPSVSSTESGGAGGAKFRARPTPPSTPRGHSEPTAVVSKSNINTNEMTNKNIPSSSSSTASPRSNNNTTSSGGGAMVSGTGISVSGRSASAGPAPHHPPAASSSASVPSKPTVVSPRTLREQQKSVSPSSAQLLRTNKNVPSSR